jgi:solute carrier family 25 carnitine/acylcarnitine transporter 20/29
MFAAGNTRRNNASSFMAPSACYTSSQMTPLAQSARPTGLLMDATAAWRHNRENSISAALTAARSTVVTPTTAFAAKEGSGIAGFLLHFAGGTFGGMAGIIMSFPLDTVKVRMQTTSGLYTGMVDCITKVAKQEGMKTFYRGVMAPVASYGIIKATTFGVYGNCLDYFAKRAGNPAHTPTLMEIILAGHLAGFAAATVMTPADRIKVTMQANVGTGLVWANSTVGCAQHLIKTEGVKGLFRGFTATASRDGPGMALYYIIYDVAKKTIPGWSDKLDEHTGKPKHTALQMLAFGGMSGVISWLPVYPIDIIKSRIQSDQTGKMYTGMLDCAVKSVAKDGPFVLYRGCLPVLLAAVPLHGTVFMVYELWMDFTKDWL